MKNVRNKKDRESKIRYYGALKKIWSPGIFQSYGQYSFSDGNIFPGFSRTSRIQYKSARLFIAYVLAFFKSYHPDIVRLPQTCVQILFFAHECRQHDQCRK